jgi:hypothetical protein
MDWATFWTSFSQTHVVTLSLGPSMTTVPCYFFEPRAADRQNDDFHCQVTYPYLSYPNLYSNPVGAPSLFGGHLAPVGCT